MAAFQVERTKGRKNANLCFFSKHKSGEKIFKDPTLIIRQGSRNLLHGYMTLSKILRGEATQKFGSSSEDLVIHQQNAGWLQDNFGPLRCRILGAHVLF